jgi:hypothetical protein
MCTTAFITAADLLLTMTTALRENQLAQALKRIDPRQQRRCGLRRGRRQRIGGQRPSFVHRD